MIAFSNITPEEFLRLNQDNIPSEVLKYFDAFAERIEELENEVKVLNHNEELAWERDSLARELVEQLDSFAEGNLSKVKLKVYNQIRENSYFEV